MSTPSQGPHLNVPDQPVARHSPTLDQYYKGMHEVLIRFLDLPAIEVIEELLQKAAALAERIREHLEADDGIDPMVVATYPCPDIAMTLQSLYAWEQDHERSKAEYFKRARKQESLPYPGSYAAYWRRVRQAIFTYHRTLEILESRTIGESGASQKTGA